MREIGGNKQFLVTWELLNSMTQRDTFSLNKYLWWSGEVMFIYLMQSLHSELLASSNESSDYWNVIILGKHESWTGSTPANYVVVKQPERRVLEPPQWKASWVSSLPIIINGLCQPYEKYSIQLIILCAGKFVFDHLMWDGSCDFFQNEWSNYLTSTASTNVHETKPLTSLAHPMVSQATRGRPPQQHLPASQSLSAS